MEKTAKKPDKTAFFLPAFPGTSIEVFSMSDGQPPKLRGYAALYNVFSEDLGGYRTRIAPGAFDRVVPGSDVRLLVNHDSNLLLGRTASGTLSLTLEDKGLYFQGQPPLTDFAAHYVEAIRRGDMSGCSFSCDINTDLDEWDWTGDVPVRTINQITALYDVGPVTVPAFSQTDVAAYALEAARTAFDAAQVALEAARAVEREAEARRARRARALFLSVSLGL